MQLVCAALDDRIDLGAFTASELRGRNTRLDTKLLDRVVDAEAVQASVHLRIHVADPIKSGNRWIVSLPPPH